LCPAFNLLGASGFCLRMLKITLRSGELICSESICCPRTTKLLLSIALRFVLASQLLTSAPFAIFQA
jgi:hypothetical protein